MAEQTEKRELQQKNHTVQTREKELQASEQLVAEFQQSMEHKPQQLPVAAEIPQATATAPQKDITKLRWKEGKSTPDPFGMYRGAAVVDRNTVYMNSGDSHEAYSGQMTSEGLLWSTLPNSQYINFSLAVIDGLPTCVGGRSGHLGSFTNTLHSLTGESHKRQWSEVFPPMPTARSGTASVTTEQTLVVAGGWDGRRTLDTVEVMNIATKQWTTAQHLPHPFGEISGTICGDQLYLGGGCIRVGEPSKPSKSVLTCSLTDLLQPKSLGVRLRTLSLATKPGVWREIKKLPVTWSTLTTLGGHLLAIGGESDVLFSDPTANVHCYNHQTNSWHVVSKMMTQRYHLLSAVLPGDQLLIVGGWETETLVEIGSFPVSG